MSLLSCQPRVTVTSCFVYKVIRDLLFYQPRVEVTSCFDYKVMGRTFYDRINAQLIYRFELAHMVARRITKPQRQFLGSNLNGCSFFGGGGGGSDFSILFMSHFYLYFIIFYPFNMYKAHRYIKTSVTTLTTVNSEIYANSVKRHNCDVKICD